RPLTLAVAFAMISSFLLSATFVPMLCSKWLRGHVHPGEEHDSPGMGARIHRRIENVLAAIIHRYEGMLKAALRHRFLLLSLVVVLFLSSLCLVMGIGREFFPQVDAGQITIRVRAPSRSRLDETERRTIELERFLEEKIPPEEREMIVSE